MLMFWAALVLVILMVLGSALMLLRTARTPKIPEGVKPLPHEEDEA